MTKEVLRECEYLEKEIERLEQEMTELELVSHFEENNQFEVRIKHQGASFNDVEITLNFYNLLNVVGLLKAIVERDLKTTQKTFDEM